MTDLTLSARQLHELELLLGGVYGREIRYALPGDDLALVATLRAADGSVSDEVRLLDREGTHLATIVVEAKTSAAPLAGLWLAGPVRAEKPSGHRVAAAARLPGDGPAGHAAVLITGSIPLDLVLRGRMPIVVDDGNPDTTARRVRAARRLSPTISVLPAPAAEHLGGQARLELMVALAQAAVGGDVVVHVTPPETSDGIVVLFTGLPSSGKSTVAKALAERLVEADERPVTLLDGDEVRQMLSAGLGFSREDRELNVRRVGWVAALVARHGGIALCALVAPYGTMRDTMRRSVEEVGRFVLIHVATPLATCESRDRKGLYSKARTGAIAGLTGVDGPYEVPDDADLVIDPAVHTVKECVDTVLAALAGAASNRLA